MILSVLILLSSPILMLSHTDFLQSEVNSEYNFGDWENLSGNLITKPSACYLNSKLYLFIIADNGRLYYKHKSGKVWTDYILLDDQDYSSSIPTCISGEHKIELFYILNDHTLHRGLFDGVKVIPEENLGEYNINYAPSVINTPSGYFLFASEHSDSPILTKYYDFREGRWSEWIKFEDTKAHAYITACQSSPGNFELFWLSNDQSIHTKAFINDKWNEDTKLDISIAGHPTCSYDGWGNVDLFYANEDGYMSYVSRFNGVWGKEIIVNEKAVLTIGQPVITGNHGLIELFITGNGSNAYHIASKDE